MCRGAHVDTREHPAGVSSLLVGLGGSHTDSLSRAVSGQSGWHAPSLAIAQSQMGQGACTWQARPPGSSLQRPPQSKALGSGISFGIIPQSHRPGLPALTLTLAKL